MKILAKKSTLSAGEIQFFDAIEPPLKAGAYTFSAKQNIANVPNGANDAMDPSYEGSQEVQITGPQFSINPSVIHSVFPPALKTGTYNQYLPNVVLTDFALPWSRPIDPKNPSQFPDTPWMGLLTMYPDDIAKIDGPKTMPISEVLEPKPSDSDVIPPDLPIDDIGIALTTPVSVFDMDITTFQAITPTLEELPFVAHGRAVNTDGKVMLGMKGDGYFSLLIGNRIPKSGTDDAPTENKIFIVSYEGQSKYLRGGSAPPSGKTKIRIVFLGSWKFNASAAKGDFLSMMENLCEPGGGGVQLMQMPGANDEFEDRIAKEALEIGYTALQNDMRVGEVATSWYRGPAVPSPTKRIFPIGNPYIYSDHAIQYDEGTGIFNHSYSAAWQIGRLLALSDGSFAKAFFDWRNAYLNQIDYEASQLLVTNKAAKMAGKESAKLSKPMTLFEGLRTVFAEKVKDVDWPKFEKRTEKTLGKQLPGIPSEEEKREIIESDQDPLLAIFNK